MGKIETNYLLLISQRDLPYPQLTREKSLESVLLSLVNNLRTINYIYMYIVYYKEAANSMSH